MLPRPPAGLLAFSLLLVVACGGKSKQAPHPRDEPVTVTEGGRRLQALFMEAADGIGAFQYFYDTKLGLNCNFVPAEPDAWRCMPEGPEVVRVSELVYTDADCTQPHAALYRTVHELDGCTPPRHVVVGGDCGATPSAFEIGSASSAETRYRVIDGVCAASAMATDRLTRLFVVTAMSLESFQPAQLNVGDETEGIVPLDLASEDGARFRRGFRDAQEGFDCSLVGPDEDSRCVPIDPGIIGFFFADPECTIPSAMPGNCGSQQNAIPFARRFSSEAAEYHRGGARLTTTYTGTPQNCQPALDGVAFEVGPAIPITRFAAGQRNAVVGADLLASVETVGTASLPPRSLRSTAHGGHACYFAHGSDGELRCLPPPDTRFDGFFADAACTQPVEYNQADVLTVETPGVCPPEVRVYARGDRHPGPVYAVAAGVCALAHDRPPSDSARLPHHVFPSEIPPTEFAAVFRVTR
jgi:hypothetical protein